MKSEKKKEKNKMFLSSQLFKLIFHISLAGIGLFISLEVLESLQSTPGGYQDNVMNDIPDMPLPTPNYGTEYETSKVKFLEWKNTNDKPAQTPQETTKPKNIYDSFNSIIIGSMVFGALFILVWAIIPFKKS